MTKVALSDVEVVFSALAHEARRNILLILSHFGDELPSGYLAARFQHSWPTTTRHLGVLERAGLVEVRRLGRGSLYRLNRERLRQVLEGWLNYLEPVDPRKSWISFGPKTTDALRLPQPNNQGVPRWPPRQPEAIPRRSSGLPSKRRTSTKRRRSTRSFSPNPASGIQVPATTSTAAASSSPLSTRRPAASRLSRRRSRSTSR